jgi:hypothetical protein
MRALGGKIMTTIGRVGRKLLGTDARSMFESAGRIRPRSTRDLRPWAQKLDKALTKLEDAGMERIRIKLMKKRRK